MTLARTMYALAVVFAAMIAGSSLAQTNEAPVDPLAVKPVPSSGQDGESDALRTKIEQAGYSDVEGLARDETGLWRARAKKGNEAIDIVVDKGGRIKSTPR